MSKITECRQKCSKSPEKYYLSDEEKKFYSKNGYLIIKNLFDEQTLDCFRKRFTAICSDKALSETCSVVRDKKLARPNANPEEYVNKIQDILHDPVFTRYSEDPRLLHLASQFLGEELTALNCMLINKPPNTTRHPSHQDGYYFPVRPMAVIASWTAIDPSTLENGCLYFVPGSHNMELLPHEAFTDVKKSYHLIIDEARMAPEDKRVYVEMDPGDTAIFHPLLIHGSEANNSKGYRKAMIIHYMNSGCEFVTMTNSSQQLLQNNLEEMRKKHSLPETYQDFWKLKSKKVNFSRSHL